MASPQKSGIRRVAENRKAFHDYEVLERLEAGISLVGTEAKAVRSGHMNLAGGFVRFDPGGAFLCEVRIAPYEFGNQFNHEPDRIRRLLMHRKEIDLLAATVAQKGLTVIPLSAYYKKGMLKIELGVCKGKQSPDKRDALRKKTADREAAREMRRE
ncbi:MAG: SsrA-binding protein SmpB [Kiritimatiellia bacterium]